MIVNPGTSLSTCKLLFAGVALSVLLASGGEAQSCQADTSCQFLECRAPASAVPLQLWGDLAPTNSGQLPALRDNTNWNEFTDAHNYTEPHWEAVDVENGWVFAAINFGLEIWDARGALAGNPTRVKALGCGSSPSGCTAFPAWIADPHESEPVRWADAPPGNDGVLAVAVAGGAGLAVFNTQNKSAPVARYGDTGKTALQVHAARIGSTDYSFTATMGAGLLVHNLTAAGNLASSCVENTPGQTGCGVYVSRVGTRSNVGYVGGASNAAGTSHWVAMSSGGTALGVEAWDVSNPGSPQLEFSALAGEFVNGLALWRNGSSYYLGMRAQPLTGSDTFARVYNVSCIASGSCSGLGSPLWTANLGPGAATLFVTYSSSGNRHFLHYGTVECPAGLQAEWLFDVTAPAATFDVTPPPGTVGGQQTGYWGWYYRRNPTGFNKSRPQMGKFAGAYFYRAAWSFFDVHLLQSPTAPAVGGVTASATTALPCQQVTFTATGVSGNPAPTLGWEVRDAANQVVATGGNVNPFVWGIASNTPAGSYTARVTATNGLGSAVATSSAVAVGALPPLGFSGPPTYDPFSGPTVQFHVAAQGATEWNWDFGDGATTGWVSDPETGPNPEHTYTQLGQYTVRVSIRNCNQAPLESAPVVVDIVSLSILSIDTFTIPCQFPFCPYDGCTPVSFTIAVSGDPDFYDYDWDGDGDFEMTATFPVTSHTYYETGNPEPVLRLRRLSESVSALLDRNLIILEPLAGQPAAPTDLGAAAQSSSAIALAWTDNATNETEYQIEVSREGLFQGLESRPAGSVGALVSGLDPDTGYSFQVRANSSTLNCSSPWAGPVGATTLPAEPIFGDGFESGSFSAWSVVQP